MLLKAPYPGQIASSALIRAFYPVMVTPFVLQYYLTGGRHVFSLREQRERRNGFWGWPAQEVKAVARAGRPIWMHAAAAGETAAAHAIIQHVRDRFPETPLVLSVSELEGKDMARKLGVKADAVFYFPFDLPGIAARAVRQVRPAAFVMVESELWPNFLWAANKRNVPIALLNADMFDWDTQNEFPKWGWSFFAHMLKAIDIIGAKTATDARNFEKLGVPPDRITVTGECKADALGPPLLEAECQDLARQFGLDGRFPVVVVGSTHAGEEEAIFEAFSQMRSRYPDAILILGPAELWRAGSILRLAQQAGLSAGLLSEQLGNNSHSGRHVLILDTIGYLSRAYALGSVAVLGGSFVPGYGMHNILEPCAQGKPVLYGPKMVPSTMLSDLESRGLTFRVSGAQELADRILGLIGSPYRLEQIQAQVRGEIERHRGAAGRNADLVCELLERHRPGGAAPS